MEIQTFFLAGSYRLDITADEGLTGSVYHYNIEIVPRAEV